MENKVKRQGYCFSALLSTFLGAAALGSGVALLAAPRSGADTRHQIRDVMRRRQDDARRAARAVKEAYRSGMRAAKREFAGTANGKRLALANVISGG